VEIYSGPILLQGKQLFYSIVHDITDRRQAEEALRMANRKLILLESTTRHDISNQLMAIGGYLDLLHEEVTDPVLDPYFTLIDNARSRISNIVQFSKVYGQIGVDAPVWQDCRRIVDAATTDSRPDKARVSNDLPAGGEVFADPLIVTVFFNLIDNALRHGEKTKTIRFSLEKCDGNRVIVCEDDGIGIPSGEKEQIFGQGCGKNTGLGLFLAREILAITGITIQENGIPGRGARFEIVLPGAMWRSIGEDA
jgi:signal transduction histidine kinase